MKANYHTHTHFCGHAKGTASDYALEAVNKGLEILGISDHAPNELIHDYNVRMKNSEFQLYLDDIELAQKQFKNQLTIYKGLEVEYFDNLDNYYDSLREKLDYLVHGQHYIIYDNNFRNLVSGFALSRIEEIYTYKEFMIKAIKSKKFDIHAHPDLYMNGYEKWDEHAQHVAEEICKVAKEYDAIFEYNANGYRRGSVKTPTGVQPRYPRREFWDVVKKYGVKTILGSDCHKPKYLYDIVVKEVEEVYDEYEFNSVDKIDIKKWG